jgi:dimethylargininase
MEACVFSRAIVRQPGANFAEGLTTSGLPVPDYALAVKQHEAYCQALEELGLTVERLPADERHPDSTFVEDAAVVTERGAVLTRPGAPSRQGEIESIKNSISKFFSEVHSIHALGTLDGGDVCQVGDHFFIGISNRTNQHGATQLANILRAFSYTATFVDITGAGSSLLHLKSALASLGEKRLIVNAALAGRDEFSGFDVLRLEAAEAYAANCLTFNKSVLVASGFPHFESRLRQLGYHTVALDMSEFQKMDGGLSCLSLRF